MANETHGSLAAEAAAYLTNRAGAMGGFSGIRQEIRGQAECLVEWAKRRNVFLTGSFTAGLEKYPEPTTEHVVYFGLPPDGRVIKCTYPGKFGYAHGPKEKRGRFSEATPLFYLRRLDLMNQVFDTDLRLEGVALGGPDFGTEGAWSPYIVTSQRFIERADKNRPHPSELEIEEFMRELKFTRIPESIYNWIRESDGVIVFDTKQPNFINSPEGIIPIDLIIGKPDAI